MSSDILARRLKDLRERSGFKQKFVAEKIRVKSNTLSGYENGTRTPDPDIIVKLAEIYDVSTDYLLGKTDTPNADVYGEDISKVFFMNRIATEFPDIDLMFKDMESLTAEDMKEVYEYIRFKMSQKKGDS